MELVAWIVIGIVGGFLWARVQPAVGAAARALGFGTVVLAWVMAAGLLAAGWQVCIRHGAEAAFGFPVIVVLAAPLMAGVSILWWRDHRRSVLGRETPADLGRGTRIAAGVLGGLGLLSCLLILFGGGGIEWGAVAGVVGAGVLVYASVTGSGPAWLEARSRRSPGE